MSFDRMGRRVTKNDQRFVYNGYLQIANFEHQTSNIKLQTFIWDPTEPVATRPLVWLYVNSVSYYIHDGNKNVSEIISDNGDVTAHYEYAPFGATTAERGTYAEVNTWRFSSEYMEGGTAMVYYNYRHYESYNGCWLTRDPIGVNGESNEYGYLFNSPQCECDILGLLATGDKIQIKEGGFFGLFQDDCGTITIDNFSNYFGTDVRYNLTGDERYNADLYGVNMEMSFSQGEDFKCCCKSGQYRWQQTIVRDDFIPRNEGRLDGDPRFRPYYNGGGDSLWDVPGQHPDELDILKSRESATVMFSTCIVCQQNAGEDKVMGCVSWGFEIKRGNIGYQIYRKP